MKPSPLIFRNVLDVMNFIHRIGLAAIQDDYFQKNLIVGLDGFTYWLPDIQNARDEELKDLPMFLSYPTDGAYEDSDKTRFDTFISALEIKHVAYSKNIHLTMNRILAEQLKKIIEGIQFPIWFKEICSNLLKISPECGITSKSLTDPIINIYGYNYTYEIIKNCIQKDPREPVTRGKLTNEDLYPDISLYSLINLNDFLKQKKSDEITKSNGIIDAPAPNPTFKLKIKNIIFLGILLFAAVGLSAAGIILAIYGFPILICLGLLIAGVIACPITAMFMYLADFYTIEIKKLTNSSPINIVNENQKVDLEEPDIEFDNDLSALLNVCMSNALKSNTHKHYFLLDREELSKIGAGLHNRYPDIVTQLAILCSEPQHLIEDKEKLFKINSKLQQKCNYDETLMPILTSLTCLATKPSLIESPSAEKNGGQESSLGCNSNSESEYIPPSQTCDNGTPIILSTLGMVS